MLNRSYFCFLACKKTKQKKSWPAHFVKELLRLMNACITPLPHLIVGGFGLGVASLNKYFRAICVSLSTAGLEADTSAQVAWQSDKLAPKLAGRFAGAGMCLPSCSPCSTGSIYNKHKQPLISPDASFRCDRLYVFIIRSIPRRLNPLNSWHVKKPRWGEKLQTARLLRTSCHLANQSSGRPYALLTFLPPTLPPSLSLPFLFPPKQVNRPWTLLAIDILFLGIVGWPWCADISIAKKSLLSKIKPESLQHWRWSPFMCLMLNSKLFCSDIFFTMVSFHCFQNHKW